jgi:hypothetical protein
MIPSSPGAGPAFAAGTASVLLLWLSSGAQESSTELGDLRRWTAEISPQVEALRGLRFERPVPVEIATGEDFRAYAQRQIEKMGDADQRRAIDRTAKLLGLFPADGDLWQATIDLLTSQVGGYYDPETRSFSLMEGVSGPLAKSVLSHELVHALEDQHYELGAKLEELSAETDAAAAYHAVVEGTATLVQNRWMVEHGSQFTLDDLLELSEDMSMEAMFAADPVLWVPTLFSYMGGQVFLHQGNSLLSAAMQPFEVARLDRAFSSPPRSTEQVLHPEKYWDPEQIDEPKTVKVVVPDGWREMHSDVLGEVQLALVAAGSDFVAPDPDDPNAVFTLEYTNDDAAGWDGDSALLLEREGASALVLASTWDTSEDRDEWHAALVKRVPALTAAAVTLSSASRGDVALLRSGELEHLLVVSVDVAGAGDRTGAQVLADALEVQVRP